MSQPLQEGLAAEAMDADCHHSEHRKPLLVPPPAALPEAAGSLHATAVPSSSTIRSGIASRVTPSIVVDGATLAAPNRAASTP